jgi:epoxyqueuosine reductase QueG
MSTINEIQNRVAAILCPIENYIVGYADVTGLLAEQYLSYRSAISIAMKLDDSIINSINKGPTLQYFEHYNYVNDTLGKQINEISKKLTLLNIINLPILPTVNDSELPEDYYVKMRMPFSHKMAATLAGLGWIGKTDLLITKKFGPRVRLATILLKDKIDQTGTPITESQCGDCDICVEACPAQAASGKLWNNTIDRDLFYSPFKCREYCREQSLKNLNKKISLCGICVSVCPRGN